MAETSLSSYWSPKQVIGLAAVLVTVFAMAWNFNMQTSERITRSETRIDNLEKRLDSMAGDIKAIRAILEEKKK